MAIDLDVSCYEPPTLPLRETPTAFPEGIRALYRAEVRDALFVLGRYRDLGEFKLQTYIDYRWISDDRDDWPFSYQSCCFVLGIEPDALRETLWEIGLLSPALAVRVYEREHPEKLVTHRKSRRRVGADPTSNKGIVMAVAAWAKMGKLAKSSTG